MVEDLSQTSSWKTIPGFFKTIMVLQSTVIFFLSFWMFQEFENNVYLQSYVNSFLQSSGMTLVAFGTVGIFTVTGILFLARRRRTQKELGEIIAGEHQAQGKLTGFLDNRTEQHLIEMIRRTAPQPPANPATNSTLPVLKREDQDRNSSDQPSAQ